MISESTGEAEQPARQAVQSFSTDSLPVEDRFDYWREERGRNLYGVTIELPREKRSAFHGEFRGRRIGAAVVSEMSASSYVVGRTPGDIARHAGDSLCVSMQVRGGGPLFVGDDHVASLGEGDIVVSYSDLPYLGKPATDDGFLYRTLKIPRDTAIMLDRPIEDLTASRLDDDAMIQRPLRALFAVVTDPNGETADEADVTHLARLALAARGRLSANCPETRAASRAGLHYAALEIMRRDLRKADLAPAVVAQELGVSVRQLHVLFERSDTSFARTLSRIRVETAAGLLRRARALSVTQVALACGFDSLATFYRAFGRAHGLSPNAYREA